MTPITPTADGVVLRIQVQPRASRTECVGVHGDSIRIRLQAPPVDGAANDALIRFLARTLDVPRSAVSTVAGGSGRRKQVRVGGVNAAAAMRSLLGDESSDHG